MNNTNTRSINVGNAQKLILVRKIVPNRDSVLGVGLSHPEKRYRRKSTSSRKCFGVPGVTCTTGIEYDEAVPILNSVHRWARQQSRKEKEGRS